MGAQPKRRISTKRKGNRRKAHGIDLKQPKQTAVPFHKRGLLEQVKKLFAPNE